MQAPIGIKVFFCLSVLLGGLGLAAAYWWRPARSGNTRLDELLGDRPWRRLGSGITVVLAVMFVVGVWVVDKPDKPVPYAFYWLVMLALTVWLCVLAVRDVVHTRRVFDRWRAEQFGEIKAPMGTMRGESTECDA